jgi:hypothetical protein
MKGKIFERNNKYFLASGEKEYPLGPETVYLLEDMSMVFDNPVAKQNSFNQDFILTKGRFEGNEIEMAELVY